MSIFYDGVLVAHKASMRFPLAVQFSGIIVEWPAPKVTVDPALAEPAPGASARACALATNPLTTPRRWSSVSAMLAAFTYSNASRARGSAQILCVCGGVQAAATRGFCWRSGRRRACQLEHLRGWLALTSPLKSGCRDRKSTYLRLSWNVT